MNYSRNWKVPKYGNSARYTKRQPTDYLHLRAQISKEADRPNLPLELLFLKMEWPKINQC